MKLVFLPTFILGLLAWPSTSSTNNAPVKASTPLSADELDIYKAVLGQYGYQAILWQYGRNYAGNKDAMLNVSQSTDPFDPSSHMSGLQRAECLKGIQLENLWSASSSFHDLIPEVLPSQRMKLVDFKKQTTVVQSNDPDPAIRRDQPVNEVQTNLFSMSEIAFRQGAPGWRCQLWILVRQSVRVWFNGCV